jgi:hypothetical protein
VRGNRQAARADGRFEHFERLQGRQGKGHGVSFSNAGVGKYCFLK